MRRWLKITLIVLAVLFVVIQFIPIAHTNPPVKADIAAPPDVKAVLRKGCYDCHSNQTVWPWYVHLAPVSWLLWNDVNGGRGKMNFSEWGTYPPDTQAKLMRKSWHEVSGGDMPPWYYRMMHPPSRLSDAEKATLQRWSATAASANSGSASQSE